jgi:hypothetical protein
VEAVEAAMTQLSLFSADIVEPQPADLGGLLATHGQIARDRSGARLSILLDATWRAEALLRECLVRDIVAEAIPVEGEDGGNGIGSYRDGAPRQGAAGYGPGTSGPSTAGAPPAHHWTPTGRAALLRTDRSIDLLGVADDWTKGAVKSVPGSLFLSAGMLRCWVLAAGRPDDAGFLLGLDPHAAQTYEPLAAACARAGITGSLVGARAGGPAIRVVGYRRISRLAELLGSPPPGAPRGIFPTPFR